jgi:alkanesulfonate monooxygenase SsuD/methylene tetrahydromethanopterin reductase-like flavin-dependent oxidoreductase (luciferase family)
LKLSFRYDMRAPEIGAPTAELYAAAVEQCAWADGIGFDTIYLGEHHGADDGYLPSPIVLGAAVAAATSTMRIHISALLAPLHDPLRLAEDLAVLDLVSGGRLDVTLGMGYRPHEYEMFGVVKADRASLLEEALRVLPEAWTGEAFEHHGRQVTVRPVPVQPHGPPVFMGASSEAAARRAARVGAALNPTLPSLHDVYAQECARLGRVAAPPARRQDMGFVFVSEDPERDWALVAPYVMHTHNSYARWGMERGTGPTAFAPLREVEDVKAQPRYHVVTPGECVDLLSRLDAGEELVVQPLMGGLPPAHAARSLELLEHHVLPALDAAGAWEQRG